MILYGPSCSMTNSSLSFTQWMHCSKGSVVFFFWVSESSELQEITHGLLLLHLYIIFIVDFIVVYVLACLVSNIALPIIDVKNIRVDL